MKYFLFFEISTKKLYIKREMYTCIAIKPKPVFLPFCFYFFLSFIYKNFFSVNITYYHNLDTH